MQIDTHIIDTTETENSVKNDVKNLDLSLIQYRRFKKSCSPIPKNWNSMQALALPMSKL